MGQSPTVMKKLAWRAKWRRRWEKWKRVCIVTVIVVVGIPCGLGFSPLGPNLYRKHLIDPIKIDPVSGELSPLAAERLYTLGRFLSVTVRENDGIECYKELERWYYGIDLQAEFEKDWDKEIEPPPLDEDDENYGVMYWVGMAIYRHGEIMNLRRKKQRMRFFMQRFLRDFKDRADTDTENVRNAEILIMRYDRGA
jgi:hypothetical protein